MFLTIEAYLTTLFGKICNDLTIFCGIREGIIHGQKDRQTFLGEMLVIRAEI